jgi:hypothetical protein
MLESVSDMYVSEDVISPQWTGNKHYRPSVLVVRRFTGSSSGLWQTEAPQFTKDPSSCSVFMLFFFEIVQHIITSTFDMLHEELSPPPTPHPTHDCSSDIFLAAVVQMGHDWRGTSKDY